MKKHLFLLIILSAFVPQLFAQVSATNEDELKTQLCFKWIVTKMDLAGTMLNMPKDRQSYFDFRKDNTVTVSAAGSTFEQNWTYDSTTKEISLLDPKTLARKDYFTVTELTDSTMVIFAEAKNFKTKTFLTRSK